MTLDEWFDKYFAPEYLNVQMPEAYKAQAKTEFATIGQPVSAAKAVAVPATGQ